MGRRIYGKITVTGEKAPDTEMRVVAWDADDDDDEHMGIAPLSPDGSYSIEYSGKVWDWKTVPITGWRPDIYVVVEWLNPETAAWQCVGRSKVYSDHDVRDDKEINLAVTLPWTDERTIYGCVTDSHGKPLKGYTVTAWDEDPTAVRTIGAGGEGPPSAVTTTERARFMGSSTTDENGRYTIRYSANPWENGSPWTIREGLGMWWRPDIYIKVHRKTGSGVAYRSPTHQNILPHAGARIDASFEE